MFKRDFVNDVDFFLLVHQIKYLVWGLKVDSFFGERLMRPYSAMMISVQYHNDHYNQDEICIGKAVSSTEKCLYTT